MENRKLYLFHDEHSDVTGARAIGADEASYWNEAGFGVFWVINDFEGERLQKNLTKIRAWFFEVDDIPKAEQWPIIEAGLVPSLIVESKRSYQVYFYSREADLSTFSDIQKRLIYYYGGDAKIKDPLRLMRAPGFNHMKDPLNPFPVRTVWAYPVTYTPEMMTYYYPECPEAIEKRDKETSPARLEVPKEKRVFFDKLYDMDQRALLEKFSGSSWVNGETYSFRPASNGKYNIIVNGKSTHCFIDQDKRIGAVGGGPTVYQWLRWFGLPRDVAKEAISKVVGLC
jgi:hypothetical protein